MCRTTLCDLLLPKVILISYRKDETSKTTGLKDLYHSLAQYPEVGVGHVSLILIKLDQVSYILLNSTTITNNSEPRKNEIVDRALTTSPLKRSVVVFRTLKCLKPSLSIAFSFQMDLHHMYRWRHMSLVVMVVCSLVQRSHTAVLSRKPSSQQTVPTRALISQQPVPPRVQNFEQTVLSRLKNSSHSTVLHRPRRDTAVNRLPRDTTNTSHTPTEPPHVDPPQLTIEIPVRCRYDEEVFNFCYACGRDIDSRQLFFGCCRMDRPIIEFCSNWLLSD